MKLRVYSDGACRGNPGPSAIAFIILDHEGRLLKEHSEYIGIGTNNQAEYKALISALKTARDLGNELECCLDSELVVKQMNREYKVSNHKMRTLWRQVVALKEGFRKTSFVYVPRTDSYIKKVDRMANQELDNIDKATCAYEIWTPEEDKALISQYKEGFVVSQLAKMNQRTSGAIRSRLRKLRRANSL